MYAAPLVDKAVTHVPSRGAFPESIVQQDAQARLPGVSSGCVAR
jgi:hypothetical protein